MIVEDVRAFADIGLLLDPIQKTPKVFTFCDLSFIWREYHKQCNGISD